ncbi:uncharacterized protein LOC106668408 isoform X2 [Cimex lectularius]|uniref:Uncharacterized protein n=1 Tax=Cimex lectularius TaxID=79782 RepID=A0A8I6RYN6_CIMLE|nr:uncharacterized protein LOC106668408 isoform X2 [Cimex lectularius]
MQSCLFLMHHFFGKKKHQDPEELLKTKPKRPSLKVTSIAQNESAETSKKLKNAQKKTKHTKISPFTKIPKQKTRLSSPPPLTPPRAVSVAELSKLGLRVSQQVLGRPIRDEEAELTFDSATRNSRLSKTVPKDKSNNPEHAKIQEAHTSSA